MPSLVFLASLRLCERLFFQAIDDTGDAVLNQRSIEVDQQTQAFVGQPQIGEKLRFVNRGENLNRLNLEIT